MSFISKFREYKLIVTENRSVFAWRWEQGQKGHKRDGPKDQGDFKD